MNKTELVNAVALKSGLTKKDADKAVAAFVDAVKEAVAGGDKVQLIGFGTFEAKVRPAREGVNPRKPGEKIAIPARKVPAFKAGAAFKDAVK